MSGPLAGIRVVEIAGIGPGPYACMLLADLGAEVIRIDRPGSGLGGHPGDVTSRGRRSLALNLKSEDGRDVLIKLLATADVLVEGFRPGVMEKLGLGPDDCLQHNPRLVYGRMTGWGQKGPLAKTAGHDINYIGISGLLGAMGEPDRAPPVPLNVIGDLGGGSLFLIMGILAALLERQSSGAGQVVDAAICDGAASLLSTVHGLKGINFWGQERGSNVLDGGAPFYQNYRCRCGGYLSLGAIEPQFYAQLLSLLNLDFGGTDYSVQLDKARWPEQAAAIAARIAEKTQDEWLAIFDGSDACVTAVLSMDEAELHPHNQARQNLIRREGILQTGVAPRLSRTPGKIGHAPEAEGGRSREILREIGFNDARINGLVSSGAVYESSPSR
ncbi:CoA transferase [Spongiibacter sp. KMU-158]|uniref:CoA transferase n=1 Tax=Spongiibacter pelagi TaxID=2760804 RepID=A0A927BZF7_9GAMM|nr:CaiB/BaiF CoA-transferase family protein [Spongiibacter pelagi]MBD2858405.1 CoA transferase [Spongiibacter pelagi]